MRDHHSFCTVSCRMRRVGAWISMRYTPLTRYHWFPSTNYAETDTILRICRTRFNHARVVSILSSKLNVIRPSHLFPWDELSFLSTIDTIYCHSFFKRHRSIYGNASCSSSRPKTTWAVTRLAFKLEERRRDDELFYIILLRSPLNTKRMLCKSLIDIE